ncbi:hypothetical protein [Streptomyces sp. NPDC047718]|uniref:hypothetical protein n=1 Tax=Streptomyces sp. NPDC047718 TaxID=3155479 RepID=UPI0033FB9A90
MSAGRTKRVISDLKDADPLIPTIDRRDDRRTPSREGGVGHGKRGDTAGGVLSEQGRRTMFNLREVNHLLALRGVVPHQADALIGRKKPHASVRGPIQPAEAEVLLRVWVDGGIDPHDAAQRQALEDLAAAEMVIPGGIIDRFHDNVLYSLLVGRHGFVSRGDMRCQ